MVDRCAKWVYFQQRNYGGLFQNLVSDRGFVSNDLFLV
jgi:hypothetical protein